MAKVKKHRTKKPTKCQCLKGWICEDHPSQPWGHRGCEAAGELHKNPEYDKDPDSIFLSVYSREEETASKNVTRHLRFEKPGAPLPERAPEYAAPKRI